MTRQYYQFASRRTQCPAQLLLLAALVLICSARVHSATFLVTSTADQGGGTLRQAILDANAMAGADTISFGIAGAGPHVISPTSPLPTIADPVFIDGYSQSGSSTNNVQTGDNAVLKIVLDGSAVTGPAADALLLAASNCVVAGLIIRNHGGSAIVVSNAMNCSIVGNFIGTDAIVGAALGNHRNGIALENAANCVVGGLARGDRNLITYSDQAGVRVANSATNRIVGNEIFSNLGAGVLLSGTNANNNVIGTNRISSNLAGVVLRPEAGIRNSILANRTYNNVGLGIDLKDDGVTTNDVNDVDVGPNFLQNTPEIIIVKISNQLALARSVFFGAASTVYRVDFFSSTVPDPTGYGEGETFLGAAIAPTDNTGKLELNIGLPALAGQWITATATSPGGDSSEFSRAEVVGTEPVIINPPRNQTVIAGDTASFSVDVGGVAPFHFQWSRNGTPVPGETNQVIVLPNVQAADCYSVVVTNRYGPTNSSSGCLTVQPRTTFTQTPSTLFTSQGGGGFFCSDVNNQAGVIFQWRLNGINLVGANQNCLNLFGISLANQGLYDVVVIKDSRILISPPASLVLQDISRPQAQDNFANCLVIEGSKGTIGGSNVGATHEDGEPDHAGKQGKTSVWYCWTAPTNGIAAFDTVGSGFDTLLGIYVGNDVAHLTPVAGDEDRGGFLNSSARLNVAANIQYRIAVDGFVGSSGDFVLSWELQATNRSLPEIVVHPKSQVGPQGSNYTFTVEATGGNLNYHWFFRGQPIGPSESSITVTNARLRDTGPYFVRIDGPGGSIESGTAYLELDERYAVFSEDKPEDLFGPPPEGGSGGGPVVSTWVPVAAGSIGSHLMSNVGSGRSRTEPIHCGVLGGASIWFGLFAEADGILVVSTEGSDFDTILAVYSGPNTNADSLEVINVGCDNDSGATNTSRFAFPAINGTYYYVAIDGAGGRTGSVVFAWELVGVPPITDTAPRQLLKAGSDVAMAPADAPANATYQWTFSGTNIPGATNPSLSLVKLRLDQAGDYRQLRTPPTAPPAGPLVRIAVGDLNFTATRGGGGTTLRLFGSASHNLSFEESPAVDSPWGAVRNTMAPATNIEHSIFIPQSGNTNRFFRLYVP